MTCKICRHPRISEIEVLVRAGQLTIKEASIELDASYQETWKHFKDCLKAPVDEMEFQGYLEIMKELILKLKSRVDSLEGAPTNLITTRMLTSMIKELRGLVRDLGALEGRLRASPLVQLTNITVKYEKLTSLMFATLCDACKLKVAGELESIDLEQMR